MNRGVVCAGLIVCLIIGSCGGSDDAPEQRARTAATPSPSPTFDSATALIDTGEESVLIDVEVAETERQRQLGLMNRKSLQEDAGMVFVFFEPTTGGFWMKNTLIPLSIAFFDVDGKILEILDMEPCTKDPCEIYDPGVTYMGALEVNQGAFDRWNVEEGDFIQLNR
jgi:uncharacterized membrane protein (UPF0127 family)